MTPWCKPEDLAGCASDIDENVDLAAVCQAASDLARRLSGEPYGVRTDVIRPRCAPCPADHRVVRLDGAPVRSVDRVTVEGVNVAPVVWSLRDGNLLVRVDGGVWPCSSVATPEVALEVAYTWGVVVPRDAWMATVALACELAKGFGQREDCAIPEHVVAAAREGWTFNLDDGSLRDGLAGVKTFDRWLNAVNPRRQRGRTGLFSPDHPPHARA